MGDKTVEKEGIRNGNPSTSKNGADVSESSVNDKSKLDEGNEPPKLTVVLHSQKMKQIRDLLLAEKLNTHALSLHLTAQSQVQLGKKGRDGDNVRPKRARRE